MKISDFLMPILLLFLLVGLFILLEFMAVKDRLREVLICNNEICKIEGKEFSFVENLIDGATYPIYFSRDLVYLEKFKNEYYLKVNEFKCDNQETINHEAYIFYYPYVSKVNATRDLDKIKSDQKDLVIVKYNVVRILDFATWLYLYFLALYIVFRNIKNEIIDLES